LCPATRGEAQQKQSSDQLNAWQVEKILFDKDTPAKRCSAGRKQTHADIEWTRAGAKGKR
jgi:hypothetical protein